MRKGKEGETVVDTEESLTLKTAFSWFELWLFYCLLSVRVKQLGVGNHGDGFVYLYLSPTVNAAA